jgi:hypothetical protein
MTIANRAVAAILTLVMTGCATMTVDVRILNREYLDSLPALVARVQNTEAAVRAKLARNEFAVKEQELLALIDHWESPQLPVGDLGKRFKAELKATVIKQFAQAKNLYIQGVDAAGAAREINDAKAPESHVADMEIAKTQEDASAHPLDRREAYTRAAAKFRAADTTLLELPSLVGELLANAGVSGPLDNGTSASAVVEKEVAGLIGGHGLLEDALASVIVDAPDAQWNGKFNRAYGTGGLGNTDIAVVMQGLGDFTLKGVRVDASKITSAAFDAVGSTIKVVAAAYGVPSGGGGTASASGGATSTSPDADLRAADQARLAAELKLRRQQRAFADILRAIVREKTTLADDTSRGQAIKRIQSAYEGNVTVLQKPTTPAS